MAAYTNGDKESLREVACAGEEIAKLIVEEKVKVSIDTTLSFEEIPKGLQMFEDGKVSGKIVVRMK